MPTWKYSNKEVTKSDLQKSLEALGEACFNCGRENHSDNCKIALATSEIKRMLSIEED